ncbi:hypothetical protein DFP73DRAFT_537087 [Morchella snyderi]|nr:hypothetical protein DFP73DRAFT_537087 [Morchella snyderi]
MVCLSVCLAVWLAGWLASTRHMISATVGRVRTESAPAGGRRREEGVVYSTGPCCCQWAGPVLWCDGWAGLGWVG